MGKDMTYWLFIGMFQGIVGQTQLFRKEEQAVQAFNDYTDEDYDKLIADPEALDEFHQCNDNYTGSNIYELQIEP